MGMLGNYVSLDVDCLQKIINNTENILDLNPEVYATLDIDKAWAGIRYLLCGRTYEAPPPLSYIVPMLQEHSIASISDFPVFYLMPEQVHAAAKYLDSVSDTSLKSMYNFELMKKDEIYPIAADDTAETFFKYLTCHLKKLQVFYHDAAAKNYAVVFVII